MFRCKTQPTLDVSNRHLLNVYSTSRFSLGKEEKRREEEIEEEKKENTGRK